jgi:guanylate kinase
MTNQPEPLDPYSLVIVLIGASAVGKSAIAEYLCETGVVEATPTWATRKPRPREQDTCYDHHFVSDEEFDRQRDANGFIDYQEFYGARYGVPRLRKPAAGKEALMVLKPVFIPEFIKHYPRARVYQIDAPSEILPDRMLDRGQSPEDVEERMRHHSKESSEAHAVADVPFNNDGLLEDILLQVKAQIEQDRKAYNTRLLGQA